MSKPSRHNEPDNEKYSGYREAARPDAILAIKEAIPWMNMKY
jgi:hypothetical protein